MGYVIDRRRALYGDEIVAVVSLRQRGVRSRVILRDNSLYQTLTRPKTLLKVTQGPGAVKMGRGRTSGSATKE